MALLALAHALWAISDRLLQIGPFDRAAFGGCAPVTSWTDDLPGSLAIGAVIGAGPAPGALLAGAVAIRTNGAWRPVAAIATGGILGFVGLFAAFMTLVLVFPPVTCAPVPH